VSKTPVPRASPAKTAAKKAAKKPATKASDKAAAAESSPAAKKKKSPPAATQAAAKSPPKAAAAPATAAKNPAKPSAKQPAPKSVPNKPASKPAPPPVKADAKADAKAAAPAPAVDTAAPKPAKVVQPRQSAAARASAAASSPAPVPPATSRFADRFAPPRPPTRQMNSLLTDITKTEQKADPKLVNAWKSKAGREMSEAEVLAMPDGEYMNDKQLDFFRNKLQRLKDDLLSNAGETTEHLREDTSIVPDPADRATIEEEHALELRTRDRERKLLKKIAQSLTRLDSGEYGFCDETGEPIGLGRLIARPTATLSLEAQQRRELKQKMFGD
jgi:DnaK suppressor protein